MSKLMQAYSPLPVTFTHGQGCWLYDETGKKYLDSFTGVAVCSLGHAHPAVTETIQKQAAKLIHTGNLFHIAAQEELAEQLTKLTGMDRAFFANSGAEVVECAIKLARLYGHQRGIEQPQIIVMEKAFHGRTLATLTASGSRKVQAGFEPLLPGFIRAPYDDITALEKIATSRTDVTAVLVEPVQGEGGVIVPADNYLEKLRALCDKHNWLLIADEVQTGIGRTGSFYAFQQTKATPDILTSAKALGNGIPIGACLARGEVAALFKPGMHGSTFGGNPLACSVAQTVIETVTKEKLSKRAEKLGKQIVDYLQEKLANIAEVSAIRSKGLMIGIELDKPCRDILPLSLKHGVLFGVTAENVVRLLPPLIMTDSEAEQLLSKVVACLNAYYTGKK